MTAVIVLLMGAVLFWVAPFLILVLLYLTK